MSDRSDRRIGVVFGHPAQNDTVGLRGRPLLKATQPKSHLMSAPRPAEAGRPPRGSRKVAKPHFLERTVERSDERILSAAYNHLGGLCTGGLARHLACNCRLSGVRRSAPIGSRSNSALVGLVSIRVGNRRR